MKKLNQPTPSRTIDLLDLPQRNYQFCVVKHFAKFGPENISENIKIRASNNAECFCISFCALIETSNDKVVDDHFSRHICFFAI